MPLTVMETSGSIGEGVLDILTQYGDSKLASSAKPFENVTDIQRLVVTVGAGLVAHKAKESSKTGKIAKGLTYGAIPLLMKSGTNLFLSLMGSARRFQAPQPVTSMRGQIMVRRPGTTYTSRSPTGITGTIY